jgi:hypothetical protein
VSASDENHEVDAATARLPPSNTYSGRVGALVCFYGTDPLHPTSTVPWSQLPVGTADKPSPWVASPPTLGVGAPQGVTCGTASLLSGACLRNLKDYIAKTGGSYFAH